ncbi:fluoride efflux transporter FluC [Idiomarina sp. A28L]|uniref:fluoride efflux transporter FluC n=1 Tax=Idiomarina sp. A28L TaxID=1036674 RepID=UPI0006836137|nr:CrcB family protein [Idiomarina sp. A28L]
MNVYRTRIKLTELMSLSCAVALGGALGALLRACFYMLIHGQSGELMLYASSDFPFATVLVNAIGCFGLGLVTARRLFLTKHHGKQISNAWFLFYSSGLFAALTTFSGFSKDLLQLLTEPVIIAGVAVSNQVAALGYLLISIIFGLFMLMLGFLLARNRYNSNNKFK